MKDISEIKVDDVEFTNLDDEIYDNLSWYCDMNLVDETPRLKNKFYEIRNKIVDFIESVRAEQVEDKDYLETETDVYEFGQTVSNEDWGRGVGTSRVKKEDLE